MYTGRFDVMLYVRDFGKSVRFYRDVLGFRVKGFWDDATHTYVATQEEAPDSHFAEFTAGGVEFKLHGTDEDGLGGGAIFHLGVEDVDAIHARLGEHGVEATPPRDTPWGWRMSFVKDPDGHVLGFFQAGDPA